MKNHTELKIVVLLSLGRDEHNLLSDKRVALLEKVGECGSINLQKMLDVQQKRIE